MSGVTRSLFHVAIKGFLETVDSLEQDQMTLMALGNFSVRDLLGHTSRALSTIEDYIVPSIISVSQMTAVSYFTHVWKPLGSKERMLRDQNIEERAHSTALNFSEDMKEALHNLALRVENIVKNANDDTAVNTAAGEMKLIEYLPTRTFELSVHTLDLARATGKPIPVCLKPAIEASLMLASSLVIQNNEASEVLLALCGRDTLPTGYSIV